MTDGGGSAGITLDAQRFRERASNFFKLWKTIAADVAWKFDSLAIVAGKAASEVSYYRSAAAHMYLFGFEFPDTLVLFANDAIHIAASSKKLSILKQLEQGDAGDSQFQLHFHERAKGAGGDAAAVEAILNAAKRSGAGKKVASLRKEQHEGNFFDEWSAKLDASGLEVVDGSAAVADWLAVKDDTEIQSTNRAGYLSAMVMKNYLISQIEETIDEEKKISHAKLAEQTEAVFTDPTRAKAKLDPDFTESCYFPIIQSGGKFDIRPSATSNDDNLRSGVILCSVGGRYKSYCSNVARTLLVNPTKEQERNYKFVFDLQQLVISRLRPGATFASVYAAAKEFTSKSRPDLVAHLPKSLGFSTGHCFRESRHTISAKNELAVQAGMALIVSVGLHGLANAEASDPADSNYSLLLSDTVVVTEGEPDIVTGKVSRAFSNVSYFLGDEDEADEGEDDDVNAEARELEEQNAAFLQDRRTRDNEEARKKREQQRKHQQELVRAKQRARAAQRRSEEESRMEDPESYPSPAVMPREARPNKLFVDVERETIICPINGSVVPFHISCVKNATKSDEGQMCYLRINFHYPGAAFNTAQTYPPAIKYPGHSFVRELTFRSSDTRTMNEAFRLVMECRKRHTAREKEERERADIVVQEELKLATAGRVPKLRDINMRPNISGRKSKGALEAHVNGFRFITAKGETQDILYSNIKHAFFQPSKDETTVLLHFRLVHPILLGGKKKTTDVQFFVELVEAEDIGGAKRQRHRYGDPDEIEDEQKLRQLRRRMDQEFQNFIRNVEPLMPDNMEFDIPYRELGFFGAPARTTVFMQPTVNCLVSLSEAPFFVESLAEIEIVHFERVHFSVRNFDMVLVFLDHERPVVRVSAIPMDSLDSIKQWLDSIDVKFYEGPANLNWTKIMKHINEDPEAFEKDGGWSFLDMEASSDEEGGSDKDESGSEYVASEDEEESEESSDFDSDDVVSEGGSSDYEDSEEDEEEGKTWDELEEEAMRDDRKREAEEDLGGRKRRKH